ERIRDADARSARRPGGPHRYSRRGRRDANRVVVDETAGPEVLANTGLNLVGRAREDCDPRALPRRVRQHLPGLIRATELKDRDRNQQDNRQGDRDFDKPLTAFSRSLRPHNQNPSAAASVPIAIAGAYANRLSTVLFSISATFDPPVR